MALLALRAFVFSARHGTGLAFPPHPAHSSLDVVPSQLWGYQSRIIRNCPLAALCGFAALPQSRYPRLVRAYAVAVRYVGFPHATKSSVSVASDGRQCLQCLYASSGA